MRNKVLSMIKLEIMGSFEDCIQELEILNHTPRSLKTIRLKYVCVLGNLLRGWHSPKYNELPLTSINIRVEYAKCKMDNLDATL